MAANNGSTSNSCPNDGLLIPKEEKEDSTINNSNFTMESIPSTSFQGQDFELRDICGVSVYNQTELEEGLLKQVDEQEKQRQAESAKIELESVQIDIRLVKQRLRHIDQALAMPSKDSTTWTKATKRQVEAIKREKENKEKQMKKLLAKQKSLLLRIDGDSSDTLELDDDEEMDPESRYQLESIFGLRQKETNEEKLIRTGHMTPFGTVIGAKKAPSIVQSSGLTDFEKYLLSQEDLGKKKVKKRVEETQVTTKRKKEKEKTNLKSTPSLSSIIEKTKKKRKKKEQLGTVLQGDKVLKGKRNYQWIEEEQVIDLDRFNGKHLSDSDYVPSSDENIEDKSNKKNKLFSKKRKRCSTSDESDENDEKSKSSSSRTKRYVDDGNQEDYLKRIKKWQRERLKIKHSLILEDKNPDDLIEEFQDLGDGFKVPTLLWNKLYKYQQTCVQWLWELHCQQCGGIIGDEMGLGKTIQVIAFLAALWFSKVLTRGDKVRGLGSVLIVTPTTVMLQWVKEFHQWWPPFRVAVLHESGSYTGTKESLIRNINNHGGILITSYGGVNIHQNILLRYDWHYVILDEGHKIRNPDAQITLAVKQFPTPHRVILSGSPLQNNLKELWSLFDFIFPGKLGTLPVFMEQFSVPITLGGYANASTVQIRVAYKCAVVLRDTINPYILRRMKSDVKMNISLPNKNEQVLFCQLTDEQRNAYKEYLNSDELKSIIGNRLQVFVGLVQLRKICNHPDLYTGGPKHFGDVDENSLSEDKRFGYWKRSGKLIVVEAILKMWHAQKHRVLLFSQSRQMLHILEDFIKKREYTYFKMDGSTSIGSRQPLINKFNSDSSIFIFLLTTRVGGLGINLTGADRVIIFDPDWNPSTDLQAKERVWRIGQQKNVTIYRLLTTGTIEEKIYHRQIFKQFLTNRVLKDPRQRRFFKNNELYDLFTLQEQGSEGAESLALFAGTGSEIKAPKMKQKVVAKDKVRKKVESAKKDNFKIAKIEKEICDDIKNNSVETEGESVKNDESSDVVLSEAKCEQMRELAKRISQQLGKSLQVNCNGFKLNKDIDKDRKKKKKKRKVKASIFEGEKVNYLVKQETYRHENDEKEDTSKHDDYVLKKLFSKTGLQSALRHDVIMESPEPDYKIVEAEADRVAKDCIKKVRMSRKFCFPAAEGVPNWTGSQETLPKMPKPRFGQKKNNQLVQNNTSDNSSASTSSVPSSICIVPQTSKDKCETITSAESNLSYNMKTKIFVAPQFTSTTVQSTQDLLSKLKERNSLESESDEEDIASISTLPTTEYDELLVDMRNFIAFQSAVNGQASTQEILEQFKNKLPSEKSSFFKALLYQICEFSKDNRVWYLKPDFR